MRAATVLALTTVLAGSAHAQERVSPNLPRYELPGASPRVHAIAGRVLAIDRGDNRFGAETEAEVALGENFPVLSLRGGESPIALGLGTQVYARFSLSDSKTSMISHDWVVGINATGQLGRWDATLELYHESSHLGDEYGERFGDARLDWAREVGAVWLGYRAGEWRLSASASYVLLDELELDRPGLAFAMDWRGGRLSRRLGRGVRPLAGIYTEANAATGWRMSTSAKAGVALPSGGREIGVALIAHDGLSTQRQFFRAESRYVGVEVRFDL